MRIISGSHRGRRISLPGKFRARPTTDFAKESLFNILNNELETPVIDVLDLFSGSGAISFEFLSRGASSVVSVEIDRKAIGFISKFSEECNFENHKTVKADAYAFLKTYVGQFDLVFADPPYNHSHVSKIPERVFDSGVLKEGGLLIVEHGPETEYTDSPYFSSHRKYGNVNFSFFRA